MTTVVRPFILWLLIGSITAINDFNETTPSANSSHCALHTNCKHCAGDLTCVWCGVAAQCRRGSAFGASHQSGCVDYRWAQCSMPQAIFIVLICVAVLCCCTLLVLLWCFRGVCCPRSWQSELPAWNKVKQSHLAELLESTTGAEARPSSLTGRNTAQERERLRGKYAQMGMEVKF